MSSTSGPRSVFRELASGAMTASRLGRQTVMIIGNLPCVYVQQVIRVAAVVSIMSGRIRSRCDCIAATGCRFRVRGRYPPSAVWYSSLSTSNQASLSSSTCGACSGTQLASLSGYTASCGGGGGCSDPPRTLSSLPSLPSVRKSSNKPLSTGEARLSTYCLAGRLMLSLNLRVRSDWKGKGLSQGS